MLRRFKPILLCILIVSLFPHATGAGAQDNTETIEVYFSPNGKCERAIIREIEKAEEFVHVALFHFTNRRIAKALTTVSGKGVDIKVILDKEKASDYYSKSRFLTSKGIHLKLKKGLCRTDRKSRPGLMHNKFAVIDGKTVITGSYNWTASAEMLNHENLLIISSMKVASLFEREFLKLWTK